MSQLALDDVERYAFSCHLDGMGVAQLVWERTAAHPCLGRGSSQFDSHLRA